MKTSLWDFSSLLEKSKVEMELSNLFRFCRHCSLCVVLSVWLCTHSFPFVLVQVREGGISSIFKWTSFVFSSGVVDASLD